MPQIVTVTLNPTVDKSSTVEQIVAERKLRCSPPEYDPGGGGINVARAVHKLGGQAAAYWMCGGPIGQLLRQLLEQEAIDQHPIDIRATTRENLIVYEQSSDRQYRFGMPGATLTEDEIQTCIQRLQEIDPAPEYLVLSGSLPPGVAEDTYTRIAAALGNGCRVILDTRGEPLRQALAAPVYLIKPNMHELEQLAGRTIESDQEIFDFAHSLIGQGKVQVVVVSLGSGGVALVTDGQAQRVGAPTVKIRSKVGAGDSTVAGIVLGLVRQMPLDHAVRFGVAAGAAAVMTAGTELCRREDAERLFREM
jgi:6-phosphofructokinase 2